MKGFKLRPITTSWCLGAFLLLIVGPCWAACKLTGAATTVTVNVPARLAVPRNLPVGSSLFTSNMVTISGSPGYRCQTGDGWGYFNHRGVTQSNGPSPIGNTGLGWRWVYKDRLLAEYPRNSWILAGPTYTVNGIPVGIEIFKIAEVPPGTVPGGLIGSLRVSNGRDVVNMRLSNAIAITEPSCQTPSVNVPLGKHRISEFGAVGSITGRTTFNIQLNQCPSGLGGISYKLDPVGIAFNASRGVIALNSGGATGVGIQITDSSNAAVGLGTVRRFLTASTAGNYSIPLRAAYYKTANKVTSGVANASLQFTITYQ